MDELVRMLDSRDMQTSVDEQMCMDTTSVRSALRDVYMVLEMADPVHAAVYEALPENIKMRSHYAEMLQVCPRAFPSGNSRPLWAMFADGVLPECCVAEVHASQGRRRGCYPARCRGVYRDGVESDGQWRRIFPAVCRY